MFVRIAGAALVLVAALCCCQGTPPRAGAENGELAELLQVLRTGTEEERVAATAELEENGGPAAIQALAELLNDKDESIAEAADDSIRVIWERLGEKAWPTLPRSYKTARGRLVASESREPLAGVEVRWVLDRRPARNAAFASRRTGVGTTNHEGVFQMAAPREAGLLSLWALTADGWSAVFGSDYPSNFTIHAGDDWEMPVRDTEIRVRVVDAAGAHVKDATAELVFDELGAPLDDTDSVTAGKDGIIRIGPIEHQNYWVDVSAPGRAPQRICSHQFLASDPIDRAVTVKLLKGRTMRVQLVGRTAPISGHWIRFRFATEWNNETREGWFVRADRTGKAEFLCPIGKEVEVSVEAHGKQLASSKVVVAPGKSDLLLRMVCTHAR